MAEKMEVCPPETLNIKASGKVIGEMYQYANNRNLYTVKFTQRVFLKSFVELMDSYWATQGRIVVDIVSDPGTNGEDDTYYSVHLKDAPPVYTPRKVIDSPQA